MWFYFTSILPAEEGLLLFPIFVFKAEQPPEKSAGVFLKKFIQTFI